MGMAVFQQNLTYKNSQLKKKQKNKQKKTASYPYLAHKLQFANLFIKGQT